jgi:hypothetical protein
MRILARHALVVSVAVILAGCAGTDTTSPGSAARTSATSAAPASPSAAPASPSAAPQEPSPRPALGPGPLDPGIAYYVDQPVRVTFSVPAGWSSAGTSPNASFIANAQQTAVFAWVVSDNLYRDPCHWQKGLLDPPLGPSTDDLVSALEKLPGFRVAAPTSVTIGGLTADSLGLVQTVRGSTCDGGQLKVWSWEPTGREFDLYGGTIVMRVLGVGGTRLVVFSWTSGVDAAAISDVEAIERSLQFR